MSQGIEPFNPQSGLMGAGDEAGAAGSGALDQVDLSGSGRARPRISDATVVLVGTLVVGAGVLLGMRMLGSRAGAMKVDQTIEKTVNDFLNRSTAPALSTPDPRTGLVINPNVTGTELLGLAKDRTEAQVPLELVKKDPFEARVVAVPEPPAGLTPAVTGPEPDYRGEELSGLVEGMRLSSIMGQTGNFVAVLDGQVVQVGDVIDDTFRIEAIDRFTVTLMAEGRTFRKSIRE